MLDRFLEGVLSAEDTAELDMLVKLAAEKWLAGELEKSDYKLVTQTATEKRNEFAPRPATPEEIPALPISKMPVVPTGICLRCKAELSNTQVMMSVQHCTECARQMRNRG